MVGQTCNVNSTRVGYVETNCAAVVQRDSSRPAPTGGADFEVHAMHLGHRSIECARVLRFAGARRPTRPRAVSDGGDLRYRQARQ
jgi:hypothetical protein